MFTTEERERLRADLLEYAAGDERISGAAVTGSAADSREDEWSDIDLAFGVSVGANLQAVISDWTAHLYDRHLALHHFDVLSGSWTYRVFLLHNTLQVDLAFVVETEFRALAPTFRLMFGQVNPPPPAFFATFRRNNDRYGMAVRFACSEQHTTTNAMASGIYD
jgi:hypothetical protein